MKRKISFIIMVCIMLSVGSVGSVRAAEIGIMTNATVVYNLYLKVVTEDEEEVPDGTEFDLYKLNLEDKKLSSNSFINYSSDADNYDYVDSAYSEDSHVYFEKVGKGIYFVTPSDSNDYNGFKSVVVDEEFIKTQHEPKKLVVSEDPNWVADTYGGDSVGVEDTVYHSSLEESVIDSKVAELVDTGDESYIYWFIGGIIASSLGILLLVGKRRCLGE